MPISSFKIYGDLLHWLGRPVSLRPEEATPADLIQADDGLDIQFQKALSCIINATHCPRAPQAEVKGKDGVERIEEIFDGVVRVPGQSYFAYDPKTGLIAHESGIVGTIQIYSGEGESSQYLTEAKEKADGFVIFSLPEEDAEQALYISVPVLTEAWRQGETGLLIKFKGFAIDVLTVPRVAEKVHKGELAKFFLVELPDFIMCAPVKGAASNRLIEGMGWKPSKKLRSLKYWRWAPNVKQTVLRRVLAVFNAGSSLSMRWASQIRKSPAFVAENTVNEKWPAIQTAFQNAFSKLPRLMQPTTPDGAVRTAKETDATIEIVNFEVDSTAKETGNHSPAKAAGNQGKESQVMLAAGLTADADKVPRSYLATIQSHLKKGISIPQLPEKCDDKLKEAASGLEKYLKDAKSREKIISLLDELFNNIKRQEELGSILLIVGKVTGSYFEFRIDNKLNITHVVELVDNRAPAPAHQPSAPAAAPKMPEPAGDQMVLNDSFLKKVANLFIKQKWGNHLKGLAIIDHSETSIQNKAIEIIRHAVSLGDYGSAREIAGLFSMSVGQFCISRVLDIIIDNYLPVKAGYQPFSIRLFGNRIIVAGNKHGSTYKKSVSTKGFKQFNPSADEFQDIVNYLLNTKQIKNAQEIHSHQGFTKREFGLSDGATVSGWQLLLTAASLEKTGVTKIAAANEMGLAGAAWILRVKYLKRPLWNDTEEGFKETLAYLFSSGQIKHRGETTGSQEFRDKKFILKDGKTITGLQIFLAAAGFKYPEMTKRSALGKIGLDKLSRIIRLEFLNKPLWMDSKSGLKNTIKYLYDAGQIKHQSEITAAQEFRSRKFTLSDGDIITGEEVLSAVAGFEMPGVPKMTALAKISLRKTALILRSKYLEKPLWNDTQDSFNKTIKYLLASRQIKDTGMITAAKNFLKSRFTLEDGTQVTSTQLLTATAGFAHPDIYKRHAIQAIGWAAAAKILRELISKIQGAAVK